MYVWLTGSLYPQKGCEESHPRQCGHVQTHGVEQIVGFTFSHLEERGEGGEERKEGRGKGRKEGREEEIRKGRGKDKRRGDMKDCIQIQRHE